jgi:hypothetical protein
MIEFEEMITDFNEIEAVSKILDAVTMGMCAIASAAGCSTRLRRVSASDWEGELPPDGDAAMARLQKVLDTLNSVYPGELLDALFDEITEIK